MNKLLPIIIFSLLWCTFGYAASNKITIDRCFDPKDHQNYNAHLNDPEMPMQEWVFEIDLKNNKASRISQFKNDLKISVSPFDVEVATSKFIQIKEKFGLKTLYTINLRTGVLQIESKYDENPKLLKCEKFN